MSIMVGSCSMQSNIKRVYTIPPIRDYSDRATLDLSKSKQIITGLGFDYDSVPEWAWSNALMTCDDIEENNRYKECVEASAWKYSTESLGL